MKYIKEIINHTGKWYTFLLVLSFVLYGNTLSNGYAIDDHYVTNNPTVKRGLKALPEIFTSYYAENENNNYYEYRPLVKAIFALEYQFFKDSVKVSHFINIILYWLALIILYHSIKCFLKLNPLQLAAIIVVFAVLPLHTEVVASLKNRDILLCFIFTFSSFIYLNKYIGEKKMHQILVALCFAVFAFLSKIEALPFIVIIPALLIKTYNLNLKKHGLPYLIFVFAYIAVTIIRSIALKGGEDHHPFYNFESPGELYYNYVLRIYVGLNCLGLYIKNLIFPSNLSCYYGMQTVPLGFSLYFITGLITLIGLIYGGFRYLKHTSNLWFGIVLFLLPISIYLQVAKPVPGIVADRFTFFASVGYSIIITIATGKLFNYIITKKILSEKLLSMALIVILSGYSAVTISRNYDWKNSFSLYKSDVKKWPNSIKLNILYANEIIENITKQTGLIKKENINQNIDIAYTHMLKAYTLDSTYYNSLNTLAYIDLSFYNRPEKALIWLYKAQRKDTINYEIPLNMCLAYMRINKPDSVKKYYEETIKLNPDITPKLDKVVNAFYKQ